MCSWLKCGIQWCPHGPEICMVQWHAPLTQTPNLCPPAVKSINDIPPGPESCFNVMPPGNETRKPGLMKPQPLNPSSVVFCKLWNSCALIPALTHISKPLILASSLFICWLNTNHNNYVCSQMWFLLIHQLCWFLAMSKFPVFNWRISPLQL